MCWWLCRLFSACVLTWSLGWKRRSQTGARVRPVHQAQQLPPRSPSRYPASSFPTSALDWRPGIGCTSSLDVGGRRLQCGRNVSRLVCGWELVAEPRVWGNTVFQGGGVTAPFSCRRRRGTRSKTRTADDATSQRRLVWLADGEPMLSLAPVLIGAVFSSVLLLVEGPLFGSVFSCYVVNTYNLTLFRKNTTLSFISCH